jgi:hypothetical protein
MKHFGKFKTTVIDAELFLLSGQTIDGLGSQPYTIGSGNTMVTDNDLQVQGDLYVDGLVNAQANSVRLGEALTLSALGQIPIYTDETTNSTASSVISRVEDSESVQPTYLDRFGKFDKTDPEFGMPQTGFSQVFNSTLFTDEMTGLEKSFFAVTLQSEASLITDTWYVRTDSGLNNGYFKVVQGFETDPNFSPVYLQTHTENEIKRGECFTVPGFSGDTELQLGPSGFLEISGSVYTYFFVADDPFSVRGEDLGGGALVPYILGDGSQFRESAVVTTNQSFSFQKEYDFSSNTVVGDPGGGNLKLNDGVLSAATTLSISRFAKSSVDNNSILSSLSVTDALYVEHLQNADNRFRFVIDEEPIDNGDWYRLNGHMETAFGTFGNQLNLLVTFLMNSVPTFSSIAGVTSIAEEKDVLITKADGKPEIRQLEMSDIKGSSESLVVIKEVADFGVIESDKIYLIDGVVDMGATSLEVPAGGINIVGHNFNVSKIISSMSGYTLFTSPVGGSGDLLFKDFAIEVTGVNSKVYDIIDSDGSHAYEIARINFNNCTSLGTIDSYRQGFETGTGRFGGQPELTLKGTWLGGYYIDSSITRFLTDGSYYLFKAGVSFVMTSRFRTNMNVDLNATVGYFDFSPSNFINSNTIQLTNGIISRNGAFDATDSTITPNISRSDVETYFKNNLGIKNTYVGARQTITSESATVVSAGSTFYDLNGTWTIGSPQHFSSPSSGQLQHDGVNPIEFQIIADLSLECDPNYVLEIRWAKFNNSTGFWEYFGNQKRQVNSFVGGRDIAFFNLVNNVSLSKDDKIKLQVANNNGNSNITAEIDSFFIIQER